MTVEELMRELDQLDPSTLVVVDVSQRSHYHSSHALRRRGVVPIADKVSEMVVRVGFGGEGARESYDCVVLEPSPWPE